MRTYASSLEAKIWASLRKDVIADLVRNGIPSQLAGAVVQWYDPAEQDYLQRVDAWQTLLCRGYAPEELTVYFHKAFVECRVIRLVGPALLVAPPAWIAQIHQVVRILYKFHGIPRKDTDWEAVKDRFRHSGRVNIDSVVKEGLRSILKRLVPPEDWFALTGRFGPGSTSDGLNQYDRWSWKGKLPSRVPMTLYDLRLVDSFLSKDPSMSDRFYRYGITKVAEVPKSIKTNRFVSSEPAGGQYAQLAVMDYMYRELHRSFPGHISLDDQAKHNLHMRMRLSRRCYEESTASGKRTIRVRWETPMATIDLSDASDYVSRRLVYTLFPEGWRDFLFGPRSTFARFPDGDVVPLRVFSPMGGGLCFAVLSAICLAVCEFICPGTPYSVYGDDIIVPLWAFDSVTALLEQCGLKINRAKSCTTGRYMESCGQELITLPYVSTYQTDQFLDITPMMIREPPGSVDSSTLEGWAALLTKLGWVKTRDNLIGQATQAQPTKVRWNHDYQRMEVRVYIEKPISYRGKDLDGLHGLVRWYGLHTQQSGSDRLKYDIITPSRVTRPLPSWRSSTDFPLLYTWLIDHAPEEKLMGNSIRLRRR